VLLDRLLFVGCGHVTSRRCAAIRAWTALQHVAHIILLGPNLRFRLPSSEYHTTPTDGKRSRPQIRQVGRRQSRIVKSPSPNPPPPCPCPRSSPAPPRPPKHAPPPIRRLLLLAKVSPNSPVSVSISSTDCSAIRSDSNLCRVLVPISLPPRPADHRNIGCNFAPLNLSCVLVFAATCRNTRTSSGGGSS
jgi:hypothetical protein